MAITTIRSRYKAIFFDLDHTLWDFENNSRQTLVDIFDNHIKPISNAKPEQFLRLFKRVNNDLWDAYNKGMIDKDIIREGRFLEIFRLLEIDNKNLARTISTEYLFTCPRQSNLIRHTTEILEYLAPNYMLHILTNGFDDVQSVKLSCSGISDYFKTVITSESTGHKKPALEFFNHALELTEVSSSEVIMIGDNLSTDILGANNASIDSIYFNPKGNGRPHKAKYAITDLIELKNIL